MLASIRLFLAFGIIYDAIYDAKMAKVDIRRWSNNYRLAILNGGWRAKAPVVLRLGMGRSIRQQYQSINSIKKNVCFILFELAGE